MSVGARTAKALATLMYVFLDAYTYIYIWYHDFITDMSLWIPAHTRVIMSIFITNMSVHIPARMPVSVPMHMPVVQFVENKQ